VLFVSFREQLTDIEKNMIVVGVRFMKKNNMIHVQIKEAELKPLGLTEKSEWKELEIFNYNETIGSFFVKNDNGTQTFLKENVDYGFPDQIRLEDVRAPDSFVITGVAFQFFEVPSSQESYSGSLQLRIRVTPFDYFEGRLINDNQTKWLSTECDAWRYDSELDLGYPDLLTKSPKNNIYWTNGGYVKFQNSDMIKDAG
ncbi:GSCOCG00008365001-RA-CDS, partial [Cotesia congregata]